MKNLIKKFGFFALLLSITFLPAILVSASGEISVKVSTYTAESNPSVSNLSKGLGFRQSITPPPLHSFAYFALNGYVGERLSSNHQFPVRTKTEIDAYYHSGGQFVVIFADSNSRVLDVKYVNDGATVSTATANAASATLVKYGMTLNGESTRWKTSEGVGPEEAITSNRVFYAQYTVTNVTTYNLTVNGGTSNKSTYAFNEIATVTANADNGSGIPFSHWEDSEGNVLSTKSVYKFTMHKATTISAVFAASPEYNVPVVNMSDAIVLRDDTVSYIGQFDVPNGYTFIEAGFLFSRSSMLLERTSLGVTVAQSNVHNGTTKEFLMTFNDELFNSIRAYVTVEKESDSSVQTYYSENVYRNPSMKISKVVETIGFETNAGFTASTTYNNTSIRYDGPSGKQWGTYYGTVSTTDPITGLSSAQLRYYTAAPSNLGYLFMNYSIDNITKVTFDALNTSGNNVKVQYSKDNGLTWIGDQTFTLGISSTSFTYNISETGANRIRFSLVPGTTNGSRITIDNVQIHALSLPTDEESLHEVVYNNEEAVSVSHVSDGVAIASTNPSRLGHTFDGWFTDSGKTQVYNFADLVYQSFELYAKWSINQYTISFDSNDESSIASIVQNYNTIVNAPSDPSMTGNSFAGWYSDVALTQSYTFTTMPAQNITLYAKWSVNQYTITFNSNGGSSVTAITQNYGSVVSAPTNPTLANHDFVGWYSDSELTNAYSFSTMPAQDITLYAKWEELVGSYYTVSFDTNGGSAINSQQVLEGALATLPNPAPTKTGYTFVRWEDENEVEWDFDTDEVTAAIILYAVWSPVVYDITYEDLNGTTHSNPATYTIETSTITLSAPSARSGYNFTGWFTAASGGTQVTTINVGSTGSRTLYARWAVALSDFSYTLTINSTDITNKPTSTSYVTIGDNDASNGTWSGRASMQTVDNKVGYGQKSGEYLTYTAPTGYYVYSLSISFNSTGTGSRSVSANSQVIVSGTGVNTVFTSATPVILTGNPTSFTLSVNSGTNNVISIVVVCKPLP